MFIRRHKLLQRIGKTPKGPFGEVLVAVKKPLCTLENARVLALLARVYQEGNLVLISDVFEFGQQFQRETRFVEISGVFEGDNQVA
jgi:hypothetical protein